MESKKDGVSFSLLTLILVILLVAMLGFLGGWSLSNYYPTDTGSPNIKSITKTQSPTSSVNIQNVQVKTGYDLNDLKNMQDLPYDLKTANGHYIVRILDSKKLSYDGKELSHEGNVQAV